MAEEKTVQGHITVVQEERFHLITDSGQGLLLTLANGASIGADDLNRLQEENAHVSVSYAGEPNLASGVAYDVSAV